MKVFSMTMSLLVAFAASLALIPLDSQGEDEDEPREYAQSFEDEDLSGKDFSKKNLDNSNFENADLTRTNFSGASLKNCNFRGATVNETRFDGADLTGSDFRESVIRFPGVYQATLNKVNFEGLDLSTVQLNNLKAREANFRNVKEFQNIYGADFFGADFRGANLSKASDFQPAIFRKAKYDQYTRWHNGFDPAERGAVLVETKKEPVDNAEGSKKKEKVKTDEAAMESAFAKLDGNSDGVLSGNEAATCRDRDTDGDGEVTLAEYLAGGK